MKLWLSLFTICFTLFAADIEERFPESHPSRERILNRILTPLQQSSWQWQRDAVEKKEGNCIYWQHHDLTATCLRQEGNHYYLHVWNAHLSDVFEFVFDDETIKQWDLKELLAFDVEALTYSLKQFSSQRSGIWFRYHNNILSFKAPHFDGYEFHAHTQQWDETGLMQLVSQRCYSCASYRMRAFLFDGGSIEYRFSATPLAVSPRLWNEYMSTYESMLDLIASELNLFEWLH